MDQTPIQIFRTSNVELAGVVHSVHGTHVWFAKLLRKTLEADEVAHS